MLISDSWRGEARYASDYFEQLHTYALQFIRAGNAYVCSLDAATAATLRGSPTKPGRPSHYRSRTVQENLRLFEEMQRGYHPDGRHVLRAKIDPSSPNLRMRDPVMYRVRHDPPHPRSDRVGRWCIYPMYDFAHCMSDAIEGVTHSLCTLEFAEHRELYDWFIGHASIPSKSVPRQTEYGRLNLAYTVTSKRRLRALVDGGYVSGWDDPRLPTLAALRRRGYPPSSIRTFCARLGASRTADSLVDPSMLEACVRDALEQGQQPTPRAMAVLRPLRVVIESLAEGDTLNLDLPCHPKVPEMGTRVVPLTREIFIDQRDFLPPDQPVPKKYRRLAVGQPVRLRGAHVIHCHDVVRDDASGAVLELRCTHDPDTLGKKPSGYKTGGVIHWVSAAYGIPATICSYGRLFTVANPVSTESAKAEGDTAISDCGSDPSAPDLSFINHLNPVRGQCQKFLL